MTNHSKFSLFLSATLAALITVTASAQPLMEQSKEIALALSSCPAFVAPKAGVYVLGKSGYVKVRDSQNGFVAIV